MQKSGGIFVNRREEKKQRSTFNNSLHNLLINFADIAANELVSRIRTFRPDPAHKLSVKLYDIYHCCLYTVKNSDDGQRNCPQYVEFYSKNKFEKLVHLVDFIIRM